jgi:hypothetical protein
MSVLHDLILEAILSHVNVRLILNDYGATDI